MFHSQADYKRLATLQAHRSAESACQLLGKLLASNSKYVSEVLNCARRQNMVDIALFVFVIVRFYC